MIVSIHSFRGGAGKSNILADVASQLARRGRRVGIVDLDVQSPGIHSHFGLDEDRFDRVLNDYLAGCCPIEQVAHDISGRIGAEGSLFLIPSRLRASEVAHVLQQGYDLALLDEGCSELIDKLRLDLLFTNSHPGLNEETLVTFAICDLLVLILCPDRKFYQGTAVTVDVARRLEVPDIFLVINKALKLYDWSELRQQAETTYRCPVASILPLSEDVARLASAGVFSLHYPEHPFTQGIGEIVACIERAGD